MFNLLKKGDKIALISPASFITTDELELAKKNLKELELEPFYHSSVLDKYGHFAGTDEERANELHKMYEDKSIKAILCVRGGYGTSRILKYLDYILISNNPKPLIGYSDITALHTVIYKNTNQPCFHAPVGVSNLTEFSIQNINEMFFFNQKSIKCKTFDLQKKQSYTITEGFAEGKLIGGNLSILLSLLSTPYDINWENKIVFIEEINEAPYKIDRMLTQLIQAGKFNGVKGIVLGQFNKCEAKDFKIKPEDTFSIKQIMLDLIKPLKIPAAYGFSFGHIDNQIILPIGAEAIFDANSFKLEIKKDFFKE